MKLLFCFFLLSITTSSFAGMLIVKDTERGSSVSKVVKAGVNEKGFYAVSESSMCEISIVNLKKNGIDPVALAQSVKSGEAVLTCNYTFGIPTDLGKGYSIYF